MPIAVRYGAFLAADALHLSGVLATLTVAMTLGHLGRTHDWVFSGQSDQVLIDL